MRSLFITLWMLALPLSVLARQLPERQYQAAWCGGQGYAMEYVLPDGCRCDCLSASHAIEVDFASKYHEALGQTLDYMAQTGKRGGILLIIERPGDRRYHHKLLRLIEAYGFDIEVWTISSPLTTHS